MDIKGIVRQVIPFTPKAAAESRETITAEARSKTDASGDREGNGQAAGEERKKRRYTNDEIQDVVKFLEALPGAKDNGLTVRVADKDDVTVIYIEDRLGKTVRRIPESEFGSLLANRQKKSGNLLNKAF